MLPSQLPAWFEKFLDDQPESEPESASEVGFNQRLRDGEDSTWEEVDLDAFMNGTPTPSKSDASVQVKSEVKSEKSSSDASSYLDPRNLWEDIWDAKSHPATPVKNEVKQEVKAEPGTWWVGSAGL